MCLYSLYNPHGSDVTKYEVNNLIEKTTFITHTVQMELLLVIITIVGIDYFITHTVQMEHATPWYIKKRMDAL